MRNCSVNDWYFDQTTFGLFSSFANRFGYFACFPAADADMTCAVANDNERGEAEVAATFDDFGNPVNVDYPFDKFRTLFALKFRRPVLSSVPLRPQKRNPPSRAPAASALTRP